MICWCFSIAAGTVSPTSATPSAKQPTSSALANDCHCWAEPELVSFLLQPHGSQVSADFLTSFMPSPQDIHISRLPAHTHTHATHTCTHPMWLTPQHPHITRSMTSSAAPFREPTTLKCILLRLCACITLILAYCRPSAYRLRRVPYLLPVSAFMCITGPSIPDSAACAPSSVTILVLS